MIQSYYSLVFGKDDSMDLVFIVAAEISALSLIASSSFFF